MIDISLRPVPNQQLSIQLEDVWYDITLKDAIGCMALTLERDGVRVLSNTRLVAGSPVIPARYQESGNFVLTTADDAIPYYDQFGTTQFLIYLSAAEVAAWRARP